MASLTIVNYLKLANLQMAAEAIFGENATEKNIGLDPGKQYGETIANNRGQATVLKKVSCITECAPLCSGS